MSGAGRRLGARLGNLVADACLAPTAIEPGRELVTVDREFAGFTASAGAIP